MPIILVCGSETRGIADAMACGGIRRSRYTFAMPDKSDLWVVWRFDHLPQFRGAKLQFVRGSDYDDPPEGLSEIRATFWFENHEQFEKFVADGYAEWIEMGDAPQNAQNADAGFDRGTMAASRSGASEGA